MLLYNVSAHRMAHLVAAKADQVLVGQVKEGRCRTNVGVAMGSNVPAEDEETNQTTSNNYSPLGNAIPK